MPNGIEIRVGEGGNRVEIQCQHQNGLIYLVPAEASWVCSDDFRSGHALAGFFKELVKLGDPRVKEIMQRWGLYFRERPLQAPEEQGK